MNKTKILPPPAQEIAAKFMDEILRIKPHFISGIYLTGSLTLNDFHPDKSDIDFVVLCHTIPDKNTFLQLKHIHKAIGNQYRKPDLNGVYTTYKSIHTSHPAGIKSFSFQAGIMRYDSYDMAPVIFTELKQNAITLFGQDADTLPIDMSRDQLNHFLHSNMNSYWKRWIDQHSSYSDRKLLLLGFPKLTEWSVLGTARQLCSLQTGRIVSKSDAGLFCLQQLPEKFHPIITKAIQIRKNSPSIPMAFSYDLNPSLSRMEQTIECTTYIINTFNRQYTLKYDR